MLGKPLIGAFALLQGLKLLNTTGLRRFVAVPLAVNILIFAIAIRVLAGQFADLVQGWLSYLPDWLLWLQWVFWVLFALSALIVVFYSFTLIANIIAAPFNSLLAEAVEKHLTGQPLPPGGSIVTAIKEAPQAVLDELRKLGYMVLLAIPVLIVSFFLPPFAPFLWMLFSAWMLTLEYCDYPMGNHELRFAEQRARMRRNKLLSLGFGGATLAATMVPVLNFLVMPAAVAGATRLWVDQLQK